jgi:hypothetical protein
MESCMVCTLPNVIRMMKSRKLGEMRNVYKSLVGKPEGTYHSKDSVDGKIILKMILKK